MKKIIFAICLFSLTGLCAKAQTNTTEKSVQKNIAFKLKNNSLLPSKVTLISYQPGENANGTAGFMMGSYGTKLFRFPVGAKIYLANSKQVNTVMSGASIKDQLPFLTVKVGDEEKVFPIR